MMNGIFIDKSGNILNLEYVTRITKYTMNHNKTVIKAYLKDEDKSFYITTRKNLSDLEIENAIKKLGELLENGKNVIHEEELYK